jgi:hypothetical protein
VRSRLLYRVWKGTLQLRNFASQHDLFGLSLLKDNLHRACLVHMVLGANGLDDFDYQGALAALGDNVWAYRLTQGEKLLVTIWGRFVPEVFRAVEEQRLPNLV